MSTTLHGSVLARVAERSIHHTLGGSIADLATVVHPDAFNRMSITEPPATRGKGPAAFYATGEWLRAAFSDLVWRTETEVVQDDVVVTYGTLSGRHTGDFVVWTPAGTVERAFAPTDRTFTVPQAHFQRFDNDFVIEHWAVRDDQGLGLQLGWIPPTPGFLFRCFLATQRARNAAQTQG